VTKELVVRVLVTLNRLFARHSSLFAELAPDTWTIPSAALAWDRSMRRGVQEQIQP